MINSSKQKPKTKADQQDKAPTVNEREIIYRVQKKTTAATIKFTYDQFKLTANKTPFTQAEWASILHISERTLQRYAKNNSSFASINAERAQQIIAVINEGKKTFGTVELFCNWLKQKPEMLEGTISFESLTSSNGIQLVLTQLGRIQHGLFV